MIGRVGRPGVRTEGARLLTAAAEWLITPNLVPVSSTAQSGYPGRIFSNSVTRVGPASG